MVLLELPSLQLGFEHEVQLLVATARRLGHAEEGLSEGKGRLAKREESGFPYGILAQILLQVLMERVRYLSS